MPAFFRTLEKIKPVYDWAYKIMLFICKLLLIADIIITSVTVAGRYFPFFTAPHWGEEMVLTLMVYMAVLSATLAIRKRTHIRMTAFDQYLPKKVIVCLDLLADLMDHFRCEINVLISALKSPCRLVSAEIMVDCLPHGQLVRICFKQGRDDLMKYHWFLLLSLFH